MNSKSNLAVLVVDDEVAIRESLVGFLTDMGIAAVGAAEAEEAMSLCSKQRFDVAIIDLRLPGMGGELLIAELEQRHPEVRYLIHTGVGGYLPSPELARIGVRPEHIFRKPMADLTPLVQGVLELRGRHP